MSQLTWIKNQQYNNHEAFLGDFDGGDGVRFSIDPYPSCYRRGQHRLLIEVAPGVGHNLWGCFDDQDQPMRWFHKFINAQDEAHEIAAVLIKDRLAAGPHPAWASLPQE